MASWSARVITAILAASLLGCGDSGQPKHVDSGDDAGRSLTGDAADDDAACGEDGMPLKLKISWAALGRQPLQLKAAVELRGPGVAAILSPEVYPVPGLRWASGHLIGIANGGFWDIDPEGPARFIETGALVSGALAGDVDADGDGDVLIVTSGPDTTGAVAGPASKFALWERTEAGLVARAEVIYRPGLTVGMPIAFTDVDDDGALDLLTVESGAPVGYLGDGAFGFERKVLGEASAQANPERGAPIALAVADQNSDGAEDILLVLGSPSGSAALVLLADGPGAFALPVAAVHDTPTQMIGIGDFIGIADLTGDGASDLVTQDLTHRDPRLRLIASLTPSTFAEPREIASNTSGVRIADVDDDRQHDIVTTIDKQFVALLARGDGSFEQRDLGAALTADAFDFIVDPGEGSAPATLFILDRVPCLAR